MKEDELGGAVAASNLGPIIWTVGARFDRRADMRFENTPCDTLSMVMATVLDACKRDATEVAFLMLGGARARDVAKLYSTSESLPREILKGRSWPDALIEAKRRLGNVS